MRVSPTYVMVKPVYNFASHQLGEYRPAKVEYHSFQIPVSYSNISTNITHNFLICKWPQYHPAHQSIGKPVEVLRPNFFEMSPDNTIIPLEHISMQVISATGSINDESVLFVVPLC